ncbi:MAG: ATP-binding protein [Phycisphaerales bacterium]|nr:ATP-binding protein [Phycisphaerales bacterium]
MIVTQQDIFSVLRQLNPWWEQGRVPDLPSWKRLAFSELYTWVTKPPARRAVLLSGARQIGKTTLFLQTIASLLSEGTKPEQILYATLDHPLLKLVGIEGLLKTWREVQPKAAGTEYLFMDEIQYAPGWQTWLKHQVDFEKNRRIAVTGSVVPLNTESLESGVGRWHTIRLATLSFAEYLYIKKIVLPKLPSVAAITELFSWRPCDFIRVGEQARPLVAHFHEYLLRGGFPQTALMESISLAQKLLREDIIDKILQRDMTVFYGVRRVLELEKTFLYLCLHDGGILDMMALCSNLSVTKPTANSFLDLLEAAHLIDRLEPFGYGKEVLRARYKVYLADPAIAGSVLLKGTSLLADTTRLGAAVETAVFKHLSAHAAAGNAKLSYWRGKGDHEVDLVEESQDVVLPFEVKYTQGMVKVKDLKGMSVFCEERGITQGFVVSREMSDFGGLTLPASKSAKNAPVIMRVPVPLACYWLSQLQTR